MKLTFSGRSLKSNDDLEVDSKMKELQINATLVDYF